MSNRKKPNKKRAIPIPSAFTVDTHVPLPDSIVERLAGRDIWNEMFESMKPGDSILFKDSDDKYSRLHFFINICRNYGEECVARKHEEKGWRYWKVK